MGNYIDIHTHLLPGFDDGSKSLEESLKIIETAKRLGFNDFFCTPHIIQGAYEHNNVDIGREIDKLQDAVTEKGLGTRLYAGAENFLDDVFFEALEEDAVICLGETKNLLVETPFLRIPEYMEEITFRLMVKRYRPILAHPERYEDIVRKPGRIEKLIEAGYRIQVNLGSFGELYGRGIRRCAEKLVKMKAIDFVASDVHSSEYAEFIYGECLDRFRELVGVDQADKILIENPRQLLSNGSKINSNKEAR